jgi:SAM-dependent methyltransferase
MTLSDHEQSGEAVWRGTDFSGVTLVLGVGTGRLIEVLAQHAASSSGTLVVLDTDVRRLRELAPLRSVGPLTALHARVRRIPLQSETVDLLVLNGVLRDVREARYEALFHEVWRVLVPGGRLRVIDILEPQDPDKTVAWDERNHAVRMLGQALDRPVAIAANLQSAALALRNVGFEDLSVALLPGYALTDAWLEETVNAIRAMAGRIADREVRHAIVESAIPRLVAAYARGEQTAAERFVIQGGKIGSLALDMEASFTEEDLEAPDDD